MDLHNKETNIRTYTLKSRKKIAKMLSFLDVKEDLELKHMLDGKEPPTEEEILNKCDELGVNLETTQGKRNAISPTVAHNSSQRIDLALGQLMNSVMPIGKNADYPYFDSCMRHDFYTRSSCIKRATGVIKVIAAIKYQFRTIYIYQLNGIYDYLDTDGIKETNGFGVRELTDLKDLPIGEEVDISQDSFLLKYPEQYNPTTDTVGIGVNARTIVSTNWDNSGDSNLISQSLATQLTTIKQKKVKFKLNNKSIKSKYPGKFPPLGQLLDDTILFKIVNDIGFVSDLAQSARMTTGSEDDTILVLPNSYISSIEVYCNNPIKDPDLEKYRLELLDFRHAVYDVVAPLVDYEYDKCSDKLRILKDNFSHDLFHVGGEELIFPFVRMKINSLSELNVTTKVSNLSGGKTTIQRIYPDGWIQDELGRNIDQVFPSTAIVNRTIAGLIIEIFITSIGDLLQTRIKNREITPEKTFEFVEKFFEILGLKDEFNYTKMNPETLYEYLEHDFLRVIAMPYSNNITTETEAQVAKLAEEYLGYRKFKIYVGGEERIETTDTHVVGRLFTFRDLHDDEFGSSSTSIIERDTKGFAAEKNSGKRDGRNLYNKKASKIDIQNQHLQVNTLTNADADIMLNGDDASDALYNIKETMESVGIDLCFRNNGDEDEE